MPSAQCSYIATGKIQLIYNILVPYMYTTAHTVYQTELRVMKLDVQHHSYEKPKADNRTKAQP